MRVFYWLCCSLFLFGILGNAQNIGVGTNTPNPSAKLEISSGDKGFLMPRMDRQARAAIPAPATGLVVYDSTYNTFYFYHGNAWVELQSGPEKWRGTTDIFYSGGGVSIGTTTIDSKAILDIRSTTKGVLMPRMTKAQRDAITAVPDGLQIFNTDAHVPEIYDADLQIWYRMCYQCGTFRDTMKTSQAATYRFPNGSYKKYVLVINPSVYLVGSPSTTSNAGPIPAIDLSSLDNDAIVIIKNYGGIYGRGGRGGSGVITGNCNSNFHRPGSAGTGGGHAVDVGEKRITLTIENYGTLAGGGGGGGSSSTNGGGGGAGMGQGGFAGVSYFDAIINCLSNAGSPGGAGTILSPGAGGGALGQPGTAFSYPGGPAGKAVNGNSGGNTVQNLSGGTTIGVID